MQLIVGLGNPGPRYAGTRHNAGFLVVDALARRHDLAFAKQRHALTARAPAGLVLAKPTTFMNLSGAAVQALMARHGIRPEQVMVVHDDLDLPLGRIRVRLGGGAGGQRGVQDTIDRVGPAFARLKIGVSRPPAGWPAERWVLSRFDDGEAPLLERVIDAAADALERWRADGLEAAQRFANGLDLAADDAGAARPADATDGSDGEPDASEASDVSR